MGWSKQWIIDIVLNDEKGYQSATLFTILWNTSSWLLEAVANSAPMPLNTSTYLSARFSSNSS